jgi:predicted XRE-type DNA-binding protein
MSNANLGSNFDDYLKEEGTLEETEAIALKRVLAYQLTEYMKTHHLTKVELAKQIHTSRSGLERLFNPENVSINLQTLMRVVRLLGKQVQIV